MEPIPAIRARVTLLPTLKQARRTLHRAYRPHIVIGSPDQRTPIMEGTVCKENYQGVEFLDEQLTIEPGQTVEATLALMYYHAPAVLYTDVVPGATFTLREGPTIIGFGTVLERTQPSAPVDAAKPRA